MHTQPSLYNRYTIYRCIGWTELCCKFCTYSQVNTIDIQYIEERAIDMVDLCYFFELEHVIKSNQNKGSSAFDDKMYLESRASSIIGTLT